MLKEAMLVKPLSGNAVQCQVCEHFCAIKVGQTGKCGVRRNIGGTLHSTVYADPVAVHVDPVEKKPLFHFLPQQQILSIGTYGCNFFCPFCQNWQMSQVREADGREGSAQRATPETLVRTCLQHGIPMIAYTYNEPTVFFEYTYDTARLAHEKGIRNVYVSNGFMSQSALDTIEPYLDAINVDLKAFSDEFYRQVDLRVVELWQRGDWKTFTKILPTYDSTCHGEGHMHDTAMLLGALGWDRYDQPVEIVTPYFASSGTGQINAVFPVTPLPQ